MAISTYTVLDSMEWAKRFNFNRPSGIGNRLEPAKTAANMVMQTILGPPFTWWWNNEELIFTCNATPNSATATAIVIASGTVTVTATNTFAVGDLLFPSAVVAPVTALNGLILLRRCGGSGVTALCGIGGCNGPHDERNNDQAGGKG